MSPLQIARWPPSPHHPLSARRRVLVAQPNTEKKVVDSYGDYILDKVTIGHQ